MTLTKFSNLRARASAAVESSRTGLVAAATAAILAGAAQPAHADGFWQDVQKRGSLRCAYATSPPYTMKDIKTGEYGGAYLDLCKQFAEVLGVKAEFVDTTWDNIVAGLQAGKWDMSPALNRTPTRALAINYSTTVGYDEINFTYLSSNDKVKAPTADLSSIDKPEIRIGVMSGTAQDKAVSARLTKATIVRLPTVEGLNLALLSGRIDILGADSTTNLLFQTANADKVKVLEAVPALMRQGISFGLPASVSWRDVQVLDIFLEEKIALGLVDADMRRWSDIALKGAP